VTFWTGSPATSHQYLSSVECRNLTFTRPPELITTYITPAANFTPVPNQLLPMFKCLDFVTPEFTMSAPFSGPTTRSVNLDTVRLSMIPECVYLYTAISRTATNSLSSTGLTWISNIDVTFENQNGILSSLKTNDLYNLCVENGYAKTYDQFSRTKGMILKLVFGKDIPLPAGTHVGSTGSFSLQITFQEEFPPYFFFKNTQYFYDSSSVGLNHVNSQTYLLQPTFTQKFETWQTFIMPGSFMLQPGSARGLLGLKPPSVGASKGSYRKLINHEYYGGGFFSSIWKIAKPLLRTAATAVAPELGGIVSSVLGPGIGSMAEKAVQNFGQTGNFKRQRV